MQSLFTAGHELQLVEFLAKNAGQLALMAPPEFLDGVEVAGVTPLDLDAVPPEGVLTLVADPANEEERLAKLRAAHPKARFAGLAGELLPALVARKPQHLVSGEPLPARPTRAVILCATPRSGSSLLADLLSDLGCGELREHLRTGLIEALDSPYRFDRLAALDRFLRLAQVDGWFGTKLITHFIDDYLRRIGTLDGLAATFAGVDAAWLTLDRADKTRQTVSGEIASRRGVWHLTHATKAPARAKVAAPATVSFPNLMARHLFYVQQSAVLGFLERHGRIRLRLGYETDLEAGALEPLAERLAAALLLPRPAGPFRRASARQRLADETSEAQAETYAAALERLFHGEPTA